MQLLVLFSTLLCTLPALALPNARAAKPAYFALAGDSTTAIQNAAKTGGGWGNGFLANLQNGAAGKNYGHNGATTVSFRSGGDWATVLADVKNQKANYDVYVTIQFGHNDQKSTSGITLDQYTANLVTMANEVKSAGGTPILVTPLTRRSFDSSDPPRIVENLADQRKQTLAAASTASSWNLDLNAASTAYCNAIGPDNSWKYNLVEDDKTHLNDHGSVVFGRIVSDLLLASYGGQNSLSSYIKLDADMSQKIKDGVYA